MPFNTLRIFTVISSLFCFLKYQFSHSVMSDSLRPHESQHARSPCPSPTPGVHSDSHPLSQWCHPAISSSVNPFSSCPQSLPASESCPMSQFFTWGGQSIQAWLWHSLAVWFGAGYLSFGAWRPPPHIGIHDMRVSSNSQGCWRVNSNTWEADAAAFIMSSGPPSSHGGEAYGLYFMAEETHAGSFVSTPASLQTSALSALPVAPHTSCSCFTEWKRSSSLLL